mmetsp:Transcript_11823/g.37962  ORF Transcript_11823/g.37962 Transcript_11823/m.37962 type:complete len:117 (+) Transcript_11823:111-461(+)
MSAAVGRQKKAGRLRRRFRGVATACVLAVAVVAGSTLNSSLGSACFAGLPSSRLWRQQTLAQPGTPCASQRSFGRTSLRAAPLGKSCGGPGDVEILRAARDGAQGFVKVFFEVCGG